MPFFFHHLHHTHSFKKIKCALSLPDSFCVTLFANFHYAAPMSEVALLGVLAQRFGGRIEWDPIRGLTNPS
jgi:hypothetical protein